MIANTKWEFQKKNILEKMEFYIETFIPSVYITEEIGICIYVLCIQQIILI